MDDLTREAEKRVGALLRERWTIDALIAVGGMAAVYKATHRNGNEVAIKILHKHISHDKNVRKRFQREGYVANGVKHKSAVRVFDDDVTEDGAAFLVMELLHGENVDTRRERLGGFVPLSEVLGIADQVLDVLAAAHAQGIVHRDIKPENLFLTVDGVVKVLDFGIARLQTASANTALTQVGTMLGTPGYLSPEQARGFTGEIDHQTDIWCLGATLFTLLCGQHVHQADTVHDVLALAATTPARSLASVLPDLDPGIAALVDKALAWDKRERWLGARSMQRELRTAAHRVLGRMDAGSSAALALELSAPLSDPSANSSEEGPTRVVRLDPSAEVDPRSAIPVSEDIPTNRKGDKAGPPPGPPEIAAPPAPPIITAPTVIDAKAPEPLAAGIPPPSAAAPVPSAAAPQPNAAAAFVSELTELLRQLWRDAVPWLRRLKPKDMPPRAIAAVAGAATLLVIALALTVYVAAVMSAKLNSRAVPPNGARPAASPARGDH